MTEKKIHWTEAEKLQVLFSIIDASKINWPDVYLPEGRTLKAVKCMVDGMKKQANADLKGGAPNHTSAPNGKPKARPVGNKRKRAKKQPEQSDAIDDEEDDGRFLKKEKIEESDDMEDGGIEIKAERLEPHEARDDGAGEVV